MNVQLALWGMFLAASSGLYPALVGTQRPRLSTAAHVGAILVGALCGMVAALRAALGLGDSSWSRDWSVPGGAFELRLDPIAGLFLAQICLIGGLGAVYGAGYWRPEAHPESTGRLRVFYGLMVAGMQLLVMAKHCMPFLFGWEIMALAAFFTLTAEDRAVATRQSGFVYLVATHVGTLALFAMFALLRTTTGSFSLPDGQIAVASPLATAIFCLGLLGFGLKAGLMPLHLWLPGAHANAPTHVSALMSGVMIKMGIYGLVRLGSFFVDLPLWWGIAVFCLGAISAVLGVAFAIGQHDLKRLLAYHSVENIGIIAMGLGLAMVGRAIGRPELVGLGLAGALLHTFNHGLFKALLFFGSGSVTTAAGTRELDKMGGLARTLPFTALAFLVGATAICGLPPLNGFISELFVFIGMLRAGALDPGVIGTLLVFGVPLLALVGALAVACFVKVYGVVFLGESRSAMRPGARECPGSMRLSMAVLVVGCVVIGTMPLLTTGILERSIASWHPSATGVTLASLVPLRQLTWVNAGLIGSVLLLAGIARLLVPKTAIARAPTWGCGHAVVTPRMQYTASSFAERLVSLFAVALLPQVKSPKISQPFPSSSRFESHVPEVVLDRVVIPATLRLGRAAAWLHMIQRGNVHLYIVYILVTLVVMLFIWH